MGHDSHEHCRGCGVCADPSMLAEGFCPKCVRKLTKRWHKKQEVLRKRRAKKTGKPKHLREAEKSK